MSERIMDWPVSVTRIGAEDGADCARTTPTAAHATASKAAIPAVRAASAPALRLDFVLRFTLVPLRIGRSLILCPQNDNLHPQLPSRKYLGLVAEDLPGDDER